MSSSTPRKADQVTPLLRRLFERLTRQKETLLSGLSGLSHAELTWRPEPGVWCALDIVDHLVKVEECFINEIEDNLSLKMPVAPIDRFRAYGIFSVMLSPMRVGVPGSAARMLPGATSSLTQLADRWTDVRIKLAKRLALLAPGEMLFGVLRHPVSGWMDVRLSLVFLSAHLHHHTYQLKRLRKSFRFK